jgi:hypothetical protein
MSAKACCIKVKNCTGVVKGELAVNNFKRQFEVVSGVEAALLFALENPEANNPFTDEKEIALVKLIDKWVEKAKGLPGGKEKFNETTFELMDFSATI